MRFSRIKEILSSHIDDIFKKLLIDKPVDLLTGLLKQISCYADWEDSALHFVRLPVYADRTFINLFQDYLEMPGFFLILITAFFFPGIILRTKSILSGRKGPGIFQPLKDIYVSSQERQCFQQDNKHCVSDSPCHNVIVYNQLPARNSFCKSECNNII